MWLLQRASAKFKSTERPFSPDIPIDWSTSYIRATEAACSDTILKKDAIFWNGRQKEKGRYVISDSHFKVGGCVRSVPRIGDPSASELMKSVNRNRRNIENRKVLNLK